VNAAWIVIRRSLTAFGHRGYTYIWGNLFWVVLSLPLVTAPAAWAGLVTLAHRAQTSPAPVEVLTVWQGFKQHFRRGLVVALLNVVVLGVNASNLFAYQYVTDLTGTVLRWLWIMAILLWLMLQFYAWPLLIEMEKPELWGAFRNAVVMLFRHPLFTLVIGLCALLLVVANTLLVGAWFLIGGSLLATLSVAAVRNQLEAAGLRTPPLPSVPDEIDMTDV
jgi:uncharacterized membrane protein YesL